MFTLLLKYEVSNVRNGHGITILNSKNVNSQNSELYNLFDMNSINSDEELLVELENNWNLYIHEKSTIYSIKKGFNCKLSAKYSCTGLSSGVNKGIHLGLKSDYGYGPGQNTGDIDIKDITPTIRQLDNNFNKFKLYFENNIDNNSNISKFRYLNDSVVTRTDSSYNINSQIKGVFIGNTEYKLKVLNTISKTGYITFFKKILLIIF